MSKCVPMEWEEPKPQRTVGRGFKNSKVKEGYCQESMYEYHHERLAVERRKWRKGDDD